MNTIHKTTADISLPVVPAQATWRALGISGGKGNRLIKAGLLEKTYLHGKLFVTRASLDRLMESMLRNEIGSQLLHKRGFRRKAAPAPEGTSATPSTTSPENH